MIIRPSFVVFLGVSLAACAAQSAPGGEQVASTDSAIVGNVMADSANVQADRIVFDKGTLPGVLRARIATYANAMNHGAQRESIENVILVADRQHDATDASGKIRPGVGNPYGFVRRAVSFEDRGNKTIVMTEKASLDEAFQEFQQNGMVQVGTEKTQSGMLTPQFDKSFHYSIPVIDMNGTQLYQQDGMSVRVKSGFVTLDTTVDLGVNISWFSLHDAHVVLDANVESELVVEADLNGPFHNSFSTEVYRGSWPIGSIGPVPITLGVVATVGCDVNADGVASASAGVGMSAKMKGGVHYNEDDGTNPVWQPPRFTPRAIAPAFSLERGNGTIRCSVRPQLSILIADAAGPTLTPDLGARLEASTPPMNATLTGELGLDVGGKLQIFGQKLGDLNYHLFTVEQPLWSSP
ncbi:MAG: hypothetical protein M3Z30_00230 [Gemmatimonadota bacterium]|nr:hypothetical protein [Gemmatimonadota bacterium]